MENYKHEIKSIDDLIPYVNNSRTHSEEQITQIASSMKEFGFTNPVLIDEQGGLIAGHGRVMAAGKLSIKDIPCIVLDGLTMSDGELAWTTEDKPLRSKVVNRGALKGSVHPTQKPVDVIEFSIGYLKTPSKGAVVDLFSGSGTTCMACEKLDLNAYMMEMDNGYCDVIINRWQNFTGKEAILESSGETYNNLKGQPDDK